MAQWTHVTGTIRLDRNAPDEVLDFQFLKRNVPTGLHYRIRHSPKLLNFYNIMVYGDLQDFGESDIPVFQKWLEPIIWNYTIRQLVMHVFVEHGKHHIFYVKYPKTLIHIEQQS